MSARAVKYVLETTAYWSRNGHSERFSTVTRTSDGKRVSFEHDGVSNVASGLASLTKSHGYPTVMVIDENWVNYRQYMARKGDRGSIPHFHGSGEQMAAQIRKAFRKVK